MRQQQFIYRLKPRRPAMLVQGPDETEAGVLNEHLAYLRRLAAEGVVLLAGRTQTADEETFGIVIFRAPTAAAAADVMAGDPAVEHGVMDAKIFPYKIAVVSGSIVGAGE